MTILYNALCDSNEARVANIFILLGVFFVNIDALSTFIGRITYSLLRISLFTFTLCVW